MLSTQSGFKIDRWTIGITLVVLTLSFFLHLKWCGSTLRFGNDTWMAMLEAQSTEYPFAIRFMTNRSMIWLSALFGWTVKTSYFVTQFSLVAIMAVLFQKLLRMLAFDLIESRLGLFLFLSSYPVLAAYMEPMHVWNDYWAMLFLLLSFMAALNKRLFRSALWFMLAAFSHEKSLIYAPAIILASQDKFDWIITRKMIVGLGIASLCYLAYYFFVPDRPLEGRHLMLGFNFDGWSRTRDTVFSLFICFGVSWLTSLIALITNDARDKIKLLRRGFWLAVPITLVILVGFAHARETRILFPPFIFVLPLSLIVIVERLRAIHSFFRSSNKRTLRVVLGAIGTVVLIIIGMKIGRLVFPHFEYRQCANFQTQWAGVNFSAILIVGASYLLERIGRR